jgi:hypothetical protein
VREPVTMDAGHWMLDNKCERGPCVRGTYGSWVGLARNMYTHRI